MTWTDHRPFLEEIAPGTYAFVQPDGGWMLNNCGLIVDGSGDALLVDSTSTEERNRALLNDATQVIVACRVQWRL